MTDINALQLENLIHNITFLRAHYQISQVHMAKLLGIGVASLRKIERGYLPPHLGVDILFFIHRNFGISPATILTTRLHKE